MHGRPAMVNLPLAKLDAVLLLQPDELPANERVVERVDIRGDHGTPPVHSNTHSFQIGHHQRREIVEPDTCRGGERKNGKKPNVFMSAHAGLDRLNSDEDEAD